MDSTRKNFVPFALLMAIIYEDEDEEVQNIANHIVRRNGQYSTLIVINQFYLLMAQIYTETQPDSAAWMKI